MRGLKKAYAINEVRKKKNLQFEDYDEKSIEENILKKSGIRSAFKDKSGKFIDRMI